PMTREVEIVEQVVRRAAGPRHKPVHLVGHSFGGVTELAVALRGKVRLASLVVAEAPAPGILRACNQTAHYDAFRAMTDRYLTAFQRGEREAIAGMVDFYGGAGTFASWPARVREYAVATTPVNILDWASGYGWSPPMAMLRDLDLPTQVVCGADS